MRKISLFIAMSVDGYIAKPNDDLTFLKLVEKAGEDYGYGEFTDSTARYYPFTIVARFIFCITYRRCQYGTSAES
ncbi:hypothetical protein [Sphingobacterium olei]|uniref:hypothetical protein n=1 Tax=Sphingobacterium olei TaxID=2571155 RepID=UPI001EE3CD86|nr:hypothetical protein [Sphingobacterium olei]